MTRSFLCVLLVISLATVKVQAQTCGNSNIALNKSVTVSAAGSGAGTLPASVTDGVVSNTWQPVYSADNFAQIDLGVSKTICRVKVNWGR